jgi:hypothetical protein
MESKYVYWDKIFKNEEGNYYTEQNLEHNSYVKEKHTWIEVTDRDELEGKRVRCNYSQLFRDDDVLLLCNNIREVDDSIWDNVEGGELYWYEDDEGNELTEEEVEELGWQNVNQIDHDIYQYYLINNMLAHSLINHTDNIVMYSDKLDLYVLGVTHCGTSWSYVCEDFIW